MKFSKDTRWHFRTQLAAFLLVTGVLVVSTTEILFHYSETNYLISNYHEKNKQTALLVSRSIVIPIIQKNNDELEHLIKAMFQVDRSLQDIKITDRQENVIIQESNLVTQPTIDPNYLQEVVMPVEHENQALANIYIAWDTKPASDNVATHVESLMLVILLAMVILSVMLFMGLKYIVVNPIEKINKKLQAIANNEHSEKILQNPLMSKEFSYLCYSTNRLSDLYEEQVETKNSLAIAKNKAEAANNTKNEFLSIVSHELRTPINGVLGLLEVLKTDKNLTHEQAKNISMAHSSANSLFMTVSNILDFSQIDGGEMQIKSLELELQQLINELTDKASRFTSKKSLNLHYAHDQSIPTKVYGDPVRIRQIVNNLLSNAVKFTKQGNITVRTELLSKNSGDAQIRISVLDTGVGISIERQQELFQPFFQVDTSSTREYDGIGLGLTVCQYLTKAMKGEITVKSELGKGSEFSVVLPLKIAADNASKTSLKPATLTPLSGTVLLAEDNPVNKMVATKILRSFGLTVEHAVNGAIAYELFTQKSFDIVLMDIQMPEMDGYESTTCIRNWENEHQSQRTPIVALTANALPADRERCINNGMDDFLSKPINTKLLHKTLQHWLEAHHAVAL